MGAKRPERLRSDQRVGVPGGTNNQNGRFIFSDTLPGGVASAGTGVANAALGRFSTCAEIGPRRFKDGKSYGFAHTYSETMDNNSGPRQGFADVYNQALNWGKADADTGPPSANFGKVTGKSSERVLQLSFRYSF